MRLALKKQSRTDNFAAYTLISCHFPWMGQPTISYLSKRNVSSREKSEKKYNAWNIRINLLCNFYTTVKWLFCLLQSTQVSINTNLLTESLWRTKVNSFYKCIILISKIRETNYMNGSSYVWCFNKDGNWNNCNELLW